MCDDFTICPTCKQKVYTVPLKEQCEYSGCHNWAEYTAWFREDTINGLRQVCGEHVKLSIGWKAQQKKGDVMTVKESKEETKEEKEKIQRPKVSNFRLIKYLLWDVLLVTGCFIVGWLLLLDYPLFAIALLLMGVARIVDYIFGKLLGTLLCLLSLSIVAYIVFSGLGIELPMPHVVWE